MKCFGTLLLAAVAGIGLMSSSYAADLIIEEPVEEIGVVDAGGDWDGVYIGAFIGGGWGVADHTNPDGGPCAPDGCDVDLSGWLVGVTAGANFYLTDNVVAGVAGDLAWADISGADTFIIGDVENSINWQGSLRGVLGFDAGGFMPYVTAGVAFANASHWADFLGVTADATHVGWTAGVGVAVAVAENVSLDLQYRHSEYGEEEYDMGFAPFNPVFALSTDTVTVGLNWQF